MSKVLLGDVAVEHKETCKGSKDGYPIVGLEHLIPEEITLTAWNEGSENTFSKMFRKGNVLFGRRRAYLKKAAVAPFDGICSGDITVIEAKPDRILPELLPFIIQNDDLFEFAVGKSAGSLSPRVKWEHLKNYEFELPDMGKQKELAELLWAMDNTKKSYQKLIAATDELVKSQFMEQFGDPVKNERGYPVLPFAAFASIDAQMTTDYAKYADYPHIGIDSIEKDTGRLRGYRTVAEDGVKSGKYVFTKDHIIYSKIRPNLNKVALPTFDGLCSADAYPILPNTEICNKSYLAYVLRSQWFLSYIIPLSGRTNMPKANREQINGFTWSLPPLDLQEQFATLVQQSDKSKFAVQSCSNLNLSSGLAIPFLSSLVRWEKTCSLLQVVRQILQLT